MSWRHIVDLDRALYNCHIDMLRDWYFDPWGWPELDWVVSEEPDLIFQRLNGSGIRGVSRLDVAKENFLVRPAVILDPIDRLTYQALVDTISRTLIGNLSTSVFGWRLPAGENDPGRYANDKYQHENFRDRLTNLANSHQAALKTDIVSCFASIPVERLSERIAQLGGGGSNLVVNRLLDMLRGWDRVEGRSGIPQRSRASCVLANCYLKPLDEILLEYAPEPPMERIWILDGRSARWMDDIWLFGDDAGELRKAQLELQKRMEMLGLRMNAGEDRRY